MTILACGISFVAGAAVMAGAAWLLSKIGQKMEECRVDDDGESEGQSVEAWMETARQAQCDVCYYRGLLDQIADKIGGEAFVSDDGFVHDAPVRAKLPQLVGEMSIRAAESIGHFAAIAGALKTPGIDIRVDGTKPADVAAGIRRLRDERNAAVEHRRTAIRFLSRYDCYRDAKYRPGDVPRLTGLAWGKVAEAFAVGSTTAHELCMDAGVDPDTQTAPEPGENWTDRR